MVVNNEKSYKRNWAKQWSICITGMVKIKTKKVIHGHVFENWPETKTVYFRKDYTNRHAAEKWAHYYDKKMEKIFGKVYLRETHVHGTGAEIWW